MVKKYAVGIGITSRGNMGCSFCYSKDRREQGLEEDSDISR